MSPLRPGSNLVMAKKKSAEKYVAWWAKSMSGKSFMGIARSTFLIDATGRIAQVFSAVKPQGPEGKVPAAAAAFTEP